MARSGITYHQVAEAIETIVASGKTPTIEGIRHELKTGSNSTIMTHFKRWKGQQDGISLLAQKEQLPLELVAALKGIWQQVIDKAEIKINTIQEESALAITEVNAEFEKLQQEYAQKAQAYQTLNEENQRLLSEKETLESLHQTATLELATCREREKGFEPQLHEKEIRIQEFRDQAKHIQDNLEHYRQSAHEQRLADQARFSEQTHQLEHTIAKLNGSITHVQNENKESLRYSERLNTENSTLKTQIEEVTNQYAILENQFEKTNKALLEATIAQEQQDKAYKKLETQLEKNQQETLDVKLKHAGLLEKVEMLTSTTHELTEQNKLLSHDKWILAQEKSQILGQLKQLRELRSTPVRKIKDLT
ncbi:MAG: Chromosome partition protein Smc [Legionellaceae bacterium]